MRAPNDEWQNLSWEQTVENTLPKYEDEETERDPAAEFFARMAAPTEADDLDIEAILKEVEKPNPGIDL